MISVLLDGISNILAAASRHGESQTVCDMIEECGGLDKLEELQTHENEQLYKKALEIIETFFQDEETIEVSQFVEFLTHSTSFIHKYGWPTGNMLVPCGNTQS